MNEVGSRSASWAWLVAPVAIGGVVGLVFGFQIRAGPGYDCPPLPGLSSTLFTMALVALCVLLLVVAFVALLVGRKRLAGAVFVAVFSIAIGTAAGLAIGRPVDKVCFPDTLLTSENLRARHGSVSQLLVMRRSSCRYVFAPKVRHGNLMSPDPRYLAPHVAQPALLARGAPRHEQSGPK